MTSFVTGYLIEHARKVEMARTRGIVLGLSEAETEEVIQTWIEYHKTRPTPLDYGDIMRAIDLRASRLDWRP